MNLISFFRYCFFTFGCLPDTSIYVYYRLYINISICTGMDETMVFLTETYLPVRDLVYLIETRETWPRPKRLGREDRDQGNLVETLETWSIRSKPGLLDRDQGNLAETLETWPRQLRPWNPGRRPTHITVNAQTKVSEVNPSLRIR